MEKVPSEFIQGLRVQERVIKALIKREFIAIYGRKGIGFLMMFMEPLVIMSCIMAVVGFHKLNQSTVFPVIKFVVSGWGVLWMCRYPIMRMAGVLQANVSFLYHRQISIFDIFISRAIIGVSSAFGSFLLIFTVAILVIDKGSIYDPISVVMAIIATLWYATTMSFFGGVLSTFSVFRSKATILLSASHLLLTGCFFMVGWIPEKFRSIVMTLPMVNVTELMRYGLYGNIVECHYSVAYIFFCNALLTYFSIKLLNSMEKRHDAFHSVE